LLDTASVPVQKTDDRTSAEPRPQPTSTGAIRTLGSNPATAPIVLHPGDSITHRRRVLYIVLLGALTALGPFTIDLYLPAFPVLEADFHTTAAMIQLTLTGTMIGFALGQLIVGPLSDKVGRRVPLLSVTALHVVASVAAALAPTLELLSVARVFQGAGAAAGGVVAAAIVRDLFGGRRLVVMLSRLALVSGVAPVLAPLVGSALLAVMPWRGVFVVLAVYGAVYRLWPEMKNTGLAKAQFWLASLGTLGQVAGAYQFMRSGGTDTMLIAGSSVMAILGGLLMFWLFWSKSADSKSHAHHHQAAY
jgi:DHA1 family bicyclomycin/chloramphenicol resistance-like MFS transporter